LVDRIEDKLGLITLCMTMAYKGGVNYNDTFGTTMIWDTIIYRRLYANNIVVHNSHSSAYAYLAFESMFFKTYYPKEFMSKLMSLTPNTVDKKHNTNDFINYVEETKRMKIELLPPDINKSDKDFIIEGEAIRSGFGFLKGVANKSIDNIIKNRNHHNRKRRI